MYGDTGTLKKVDDINVITFRRSLNASPDKVWEAITTADGLTSWLAVSAAVDGREGGAVEIEFDDDERVSGTITRWDPTSSFAHTWLINGEVESDLEYSLTPTDRGTDIMLVHTGLPDEMCGGYTPGWHAFLERLTAQIAGEDAPDWLTVFEAAAPLYAQAT